MRTRSISLKKGEVKKDEDEPDWVNCATGCNPASADAKPLSY